MKAWEIERNNILQVVPCYEEDDNETIWEESSSGIETAQDEMIKMYWHSQVPGSRAHESIVVAAIQATENKGYIVPEGMDLLERGKKALEEQDIAELHKTTYAIFEACRKAQNGRQYRTCRESEDPFHA